MPGTNKQILGEANAAISQGDHERFLSFCTDDTEWVFVGDKTLKGKDAVRQYMKVAYKEPPKFNVSGLIEEGEMLAASGDISLKDENGIEQKFKYCDVWRFKDGKMAALQAYVIKVG